LSQTGPENANGPAGAENGPAGAESEVRPPPAGDRDLELAVVEALEEYQDRSMAVLGENEGDAEAAIKGLIELHLDWTEEDRDRAVLVSRNRNAAATGPFGDRLARSNAEWFSKMKSWIDTQAEAGRVKPVSFNLLHAVVFAPTQEIARLWLAGRLKRTPASYAEDLGAAAWAAVQALPPRRQAP
jgi:hypothetical protein